MKNFERGSEWRRWDPHVHTKDTNKNDQFKSADFDTFCVTLFKKAIANNIEAIGITDYFEISNFNRVSDFVSNLDSCSELTSEEKASIRNIFLFPNIELRMLPVTDSGVLVNIHCLFNPDSGFLRTLQHDFFSSLKYAGYAMNREGFIALGKSGDPTLNDDESYKKGLNEFHIDHAQLKQLLDSNPKLKANTIVVVSNSNKDGASGLQKHYELFESEPGSLDAIRRNIYELSDAIFSGNPKDRTFFLGEKAGLGPEIIKQKCGSLKPCLHGADAHSEDKLFQPDEDRYCWIKANLSFDGLKQILCEPKARIQIQANTPEEKNGYHVISSVEIDDEICKQEIVFNPNLNSIIGGRSTGKSTLLQLVANRINPEVVDESAFIKSIPAENITIVWQDKEENKDRDIEFFPQNHMYEIARDTKKKDDLIKDIVEDEDKGEYLLNYERFCAKNAARLQANVDALFELQSKINILRSDLKELGDKSGLENEINSLKQRMQDSNSGESFSKEDLKEYEGLKKNIIDLQLELKTLNDNKKEIEGLRDESILDSSFSYKFNQLSEEQEKSIQRIYDVVSSEATTKWKKELNAIIVAIDERVKSCNTKIVDIEESREYQKGVVGLEGNKQYEELNSRLLAETKKLNEINTLQTQSDKVVDQKNKLFSETITNHVSYETEIDDLVARFTLVHDDIEIKIRKEFRQEKCDGLLKDFINMQGNKRQEYVKYFGELYQVNVREKLEEFLQNALENKIELKNHKEMRDLAKAVLVENWFSRTYEITYQNDIFNNMSDGKKAFVVLKLLLEFSNKKCPILIDQPEDSLDNRAIYDELVTYLEKKKKDRQVILVTHNSNIVVNADSEEIIVANQHGDDVKNVNGIKFQYVSGSLEHTVSKDKSEEIVLKSQGIREHVCEILEGGTEAFKKRDSKYAITEPISH